MHLSETGHNGVGAFSAGIKTNATIQFDAIRNDSAKHGLVFLSLQSTQQFAAERPGG